MDFTAETQRFRRETLRRDKNLSESLRLSLCLGGKIHKQQLGLFLAK